MDREHRIGPLVAAGALLGVGMGGFVDGILFHQLLQWHGMISAIRPPTTLVNKSVNEFWDGVFHVFTWLATAGGLALLWRVTERRDVVRSTYAFVGSLVLGWGAFNVIEGIVDHHLIKLHNVAEASVSPAAWNIGFLVGSAVLVGVGATLIGLGVRTDVETFRSGARTAPAEGAVHANARP